MKKIRKILVLVIVVCLAFGIVACGESASVQQTQSGTLKKENQDRIVESQAAVESVQESDTEALEDNKTSEKEPLTSESDVLVVYFSATGTTKGVAEKIAALANADMYEIVPAEPYSDADLNYNDSQSRSSVEMDDPDVRPEIGTGSISLEGYSTIYIGYPIWNGDAPRIMSTFVETYDFGGITVTPFCTSGGSSIGSSGDNIAEQAGSGNWLSGQRFSGEVSESDLQSWIDGLQ